MGHTVNDGCWKAKKNRALSKIEDLFINFEVIKYNKKCILRNRCLSNAAVSNTPCALDWIQTAELLTWQICGATGSSDCDGSSSSRGNRGHGGGSGGSRGSNDEASSVHKAPATEGHVQQNHEAPVSAKCLTASSRAVKFPGPATSSGGQIKCLCRPDMAWIFDYLV